MKPNYIAMIESAETPDEQKRRERAYMLALELVHYALQRATGQVPEEADLDDAIARRPDVVDWFFAAAYRAISDGLDERVAFFRVAGVWVHTTEPTRRRRLVNGLRYLCAHVTFYVRARIRNYERRCAEQAVSAEDYLDGNVDLGR